MSLVVIYTLKEMDREITSTKSDSPPSGGDTLRKVLRCMIAVKRQFLWSMQYRIEVEKSIKKYTMLNQFQPVWTRPLDEEEKKQLFGNNPNYIKNIGRGIDGKEWRLMNEDRKCKSLWA